MRVGLPVSIAKLVEPCLLLALAPLFAVPHLIVRKAVVVAKVVGPHQCRRDVEQLVASHNHHI